MAQPAPAHQSVGRRKASVARIYLKEGSGKITVNGKTLENYFPLETNQFVIFQPLRLVGQEGKWDININLKGGGTTGQSGAARLGISRALLKTDPDLRPKLKKAGFLTRDPREVERKKYGLAGARRRYQYSKR